MKLTHRWLGLAVALNSFLILSAGCGGSGHSIDGGGTAATSGAASLTINWPVRTRGITAPVAANSVLVAVIRADTQQVVSSQVVARPAAGTTFTHLNLSPLPLTTLQIGVAAYPNADGTGTIQATGTTRFTLSAQSTSTDLSFAFSSTIDHVTASVSKAKIAVSNAADLTLTAFDSAGDIVLTEPTSFTWTVADTHIAAIHPTSTGFQVVGQNIGSTTLTVTDSESGKSAQTGITVGFPLTASVAAQGTRGPVAFSVNAPDDTGQIQAFSPAQFRWVNLLNGQYSVVTLNGTAATLYAPATYGDRQFVKWVQDGADAGTDPTITLDPTVLTTTSLSAVYQPRGVDSSGGFSPNVLGDIDPASGLPTVPVLWNLSQPIKVTFLTRDLYTDNLKQQAVAGFNYWTSVTGGLLQYTILPNDDPTDADVVVGFTTAENPNPLPTEFLPAGTAPYTLPLTSNAKIAGLTFYAQQNGAGVGQRVILMFANRFPNPVWASVACHEMGHAMGIDGHSAGSGDLMYPYITVLNNTEIFNGLPLERDVNTVFTLYNLSSPISTESRHASIHRAAAVTRTGARAGKITVTAIP